MTNESTWSEAASQRLGARAFSFFSWLSAPRSWRSLSWNGLLILSDGCWCSASSAKSAISIGSSGIEPRPWFFLISSAFQLIGGFTIAREFQISRFGPHWNGSPSTAPPRFSAGIARSAGRRLPKWGISDVSSGRITRACASSGMSSLASVTRSYEPCESSAVVSSPGPR